MLDYYLYNENVTNRLKEEWSKYGKIIIAVDFDDTLYDFHQKGRTYQNVISLLRRCEKIGAYIIIFTGNKDTEMITKFLIDNKIPFDKINENMEFVKSDTRKIYFNVLLDDRAGLQSAFTSLVGAVEFMEMRLNISKID